MKILFSLIMQVLLLNVAFAQKPSAKVDAKKFFKDEPIVNMKISTDLKQFLSSKMKNGQKLRARVETEIDGKEINEPITIEARGIMRKQICNIPPLKVNFKSTASPVLSSLGSLKLVNTCRDNKVGNEYLFKEYLIYKMYNLISDKSLRTRLLKLTYVDSSGKKNSLNTYGFLIEDMSVMAKRNQCVERFRSISHMELTERQQMARVAIFQYMIGNLDWSVKGKHNVRLIVAKKDTNGISYPVPYDFDYAGLVDADYAVPPEDLGLQNVTERLYRGFIRTPEELKVITDDFLKQKDNIYKLVRDFDLLPSGVRSQMITYLEPFFQLISKPSSIKREFIDNGRKIE
ncbi:MAG: hypothetical protein ABIR81_09430 [Ginsengibacter sp.]